MDIVDQLIQALTPDLDLSNAQRRAAAQHLTAWARARAQLPDSHEKMQALLRGIARIGTTFSLRLDDRDGLVVEATERDTQLVLERGASWFHGGAWQNVILAAVSSASTSPT